jgi:hypothetical protein
VGGGGDAISNWDECFLVGSCTYFGTLLYKFTSKDATLLSPICKEWLLVHMGN